MFVVCKDCEGRGFFKSDKRAVLCRNCGGAGRLYVPKPHVFRTRRKAVVQSLRLRRVPGMGDGYRVVVREARLGCERARAYLKKRVRVQNGIKLGRWSWSRGPRAAKTWKINPWAVLLRGLAECL
jgi:hypothetical protein